MIDHEIRQRRRESVEWNLAIRQIVSISTALEDTELTIVEATKGASRTALSGPRQKTPQGDSFSASDSTAVTTPLFVLFAGANDILFNANISASQSYQVLAQAEAELRDAHPTAEVLTITPPDLARLPYGFFIDNIAKQQLQTYTDLLGDLLGGSKTGAVNVDLRPLFDDFEYYATPEAYGFADLGKYGSCLVGAYGETPNVTICGDAEKQVYWDEYQ
ncbi:Phosphatidylcholine-sterol acyltransferase [Colletotrichum sp. SAR 10_98]|nr:Phosphatidylcholine-sterol acyltransferase [Colletotrichum sp. SAR 10_98]